MTGEWGAAARCQGFVHKLVVMVAYSEGVLYLFDFSVQGRRATPDDLEPKTYQTLHSKPPKKHTPSI